MSRAGVARWVLSWLPSGAYMSLIWTLSAQSQPLALPDVPFRDKFAHGLEYGVLVVLNLWALRRTSAGGQLRSVVTAVLLTSAWGYLDELHQAFVPGRNSDIYDWLADTLGALLFAIAAAIAWRGRTAGERERARG